MCTITPGYKIQLPNGKQSYLLYQLLHFTSVQKVSFSPTSSSSLGFPTVLKGTEQHHVMHVKIHFRNRNLQVR